MNPPCPAHEPIIVITYFDPAEAAHFVDYGIGFDSGKTYVLPPERWRAGMGGSHYYEGLGEWVIE